MRRLALLAALVAAPAFGQDSPKPAAPPEPKKPAAPAKPKPPRVAFDDPAKAKADADFALQGEFEGNGAAGKIGAQVAAQGEGKFTIKLYPGGLPGAGFTGEATKVLAAAREGDATTAAVKAATTAPAPKTDATERPAVADVGSLSADTLTLREGEGSVVLRRVERSSPTLGAKPPAGAVVLFGAAGDEAKWNGGKLVKLSDGEFLNNGIKSKESFGAFTAHVEFRLPYMPNSRGQGRGNSGVYLQDRYELQVLDSFSLKGENNECGGFYTLHKPKVNMCLPPLVWQTYDITFTPAQFDADGKKTANARVSVSHNGVVIHDNVELKGPTGGGQKEAPAPGPLQFQNHGDPVVFRNVWVAPGR